MLRAYMLRSRVPQIVVVWFWILKYLPQLQVKWSYTKLESLGSGNMFRPSLLQLYLGK